jgi:enoyl-[acyl-carrier protein] reductase III
VKQGRAVLILGVSSGFGAAAARAFAAAGHDVLGVHLDRRQGQAAADALAEELRRAGARVAFFNRNAADDVARAEVVAECAALLASWDAAVDVLLHSLAFGTLRPLVHGAEKPVQRKQLEMTLDVMANSLVWWVQDLLGAGLLRTASAPGAADGARLFALTSSGSHSAIPQYGPVAAAKAALECYVRQLALELAPLGITANALMAGVTETPALAKIPGADALVEGARRKNPFGRLTRPEDVARALVDLSRGGTAWINGNVLRVDGGEDFCA